MDCIFCKIIHGDIPCYKVYEDDTVLAFLDISPMANGHTLIIPKEHTLDITTIDKDTLLHVYDVAKKIAKVYEEKLGIKGYMLLQNTGEEQEVKHYHLHIIPDKSKKYDLVDVKDIYEKIGTIN